MTDREVLRPVGGTLPAGYAEPCRVPGLEAHGLLVPDAETFQALHRPGRSLPVWVEFDDPGWAPVTLAERVAAQGPVYLLESPGAPADLDRRSILAWEPEFEAWLEDGGVRFSRAGASGARLPRAEGRHPLDVLRRTLAREGGHAVPYADGFSGGWIGYFAYDFKNWLERLPDTVRDELRVPDFRLGWVRRLVSWDHRRGRMRLVIQHRCTSRRAAVDRQRALDTLQAFEAEVEARMTGPEARPERTRRAAARVVPATLRSNRTRAGYDRMLARARRHILAGDIYQANLSHRFEAPFDGDTLALYRHLRAINPSPFATWMHFPEHDVVSCSPERLVHVERSRVVTRPIAGTRPRGDTRADDSQLEHDLLASEKERAEHLMIVDMARNDIGRVCELGSVEVESFMSIERYSHVRHLVSNVTGRLDGRYDAVDVLEATFPGASITGVPKIRCMQIIDELEGVRRGVYTGSAGYLGLDGSMDLNILIRTFFVQGGRATFSVGGGIVADSDPEFEYQETLAKGRALLEALRAAARGDVPVPRQGSGRPAPGAVVAPRARRTPRAGR